MLEACRAAGFDAQERDGLLLLTPTEERLRRLNLPQSIDVDWASAAAPLAAFAVRLMRREDRPLTENGLRLAVETLRLLWQDDEHVRRGLPMLRARARKSAPSYSSGLDRRKEISSGQVSVCSLR